MARITVKRQMCKACGFCIESCPKGLIVIDKSLNKQGIRPVRFKGGACIGCAACAVVCPECCIEVYK